MSQIVRFSALVSRDAFQSGDLSDETSIDLKAYFVAVKLRYESGEEFPYDLEELIPTVYPRKDHAVRVLEEMFTQDIDYRRSPKMGNEANPNPPMDYRLSPLAFEFMVARKSKPIFAIYHKVFHAATGNHRQSDTDSGSYRGIEAALRLTPLAIEAARAHGFVGNHLSLSADRIIRRATNISVLDYMGESKLIANPKGKTYNPTELGSFSNPPISGRVMNKLLLAAGLQTLDRATMAWIPTDKAEGLCEWIDLGRTHNNGAPVKQLRWFKDVLNVLFPEMEKEAA